MCVGASHGISTPWPTKDQLANKHGMHRMLLEDGSLRRRDAKNMQGNDLDAPTKGFFPRREGMLANGISGSLKGASRAVDPGTTSPKQSTIGSNRKVNSWIPRLRYHDDRRRRG